MGGGGWGCGGLGGREFEMVVVILGVVEIWGVFCDGVFWFLVLF